MIRKAMHCISFVGGLAGATVFPSGAGALTPNSGNQVVALSEKAATEAPRQPARARTGRHYRHRGGRHPFYGSGH